MIPKTATASEATRPFKQLCATFSITASIVVSLLSSAIAGDDAGAIQAAVTAAQTSYGMSSPGVFGLFIVIENPPYARVSATNDTLGYGSMSYVLSNTSGNWTILGQGGGLLGRSEMLAFGVPPENAQRLAGSGCTEPQNLGPPYIGRTYDFYKNGIRVTRRQIDARVYKLVLARGPSVLPRKSVVTSYKGHRSTVHVIMPLDSYICKL
jgi:hypothetical protein